MAMGGDKKKCKNNEMFFYEQITRQIHAKEVWCDTPLERCARVKQAASTKIGLPADPPSERGQNGMTRLQNARVIVVGNEKGGSGKSTTAIHLIVALLGLGWRVASIDADSRQRSLTRYLDNRCITATRTRRPLPMPVHEALDPLVAGDAPDALEQQLVSALVKFSREHDIVIIDTPGSHCAVSRLCHAFADILVTPINDSFVDLDVLAKVESIGDDAGERFRIRKPSHYAEVVWEARKDRAGRDGGTIDWIVMRNRLSSLDARNKRRIETVLADLSQRFGFRLAPGFG